MSVGIRQDNEFYRMDGDFDEKTVAEFVDAYVKGSLKVLSRSTLCVGFLFLDTPADFIDSVHHWFGVSCEHPMI